LIVYHAAWIVPVSGPPLRDGWVSVEGDRIVGCGASIDESHQTAMSVDLGGTAILPGLVNAHTHLELSYLRGMAPSSGSFLEWIRALLAERRRRPDPESPEILHGVHAGIAEALRCGTAVIGDITNSLVTLGPLAASPLAALVFLELIGFNPADAAALVDEATVRVEALPATDRVRASLAAHSPYSVAPQVISSIAERAARRLSRPTSIHASESVEEIEFVRTGGGPWRQLLESLGVWNARWTVPGLSPVQYLDDLGFLSSTTLAVHGVQASPADLARLAARGTTIVACPRSNVRTGAGTPPIESFYASGAAVAVGTDSLASTPDLNIFAELAEMRKLASSVPARLLIDSATRQGARALGFGGYGTIESGSPARLIAVNVPSSIGDVEEYLVSGIQPEQIRWIDS
jgi:cytosine/adenosine deaminase-related metal-dependent hydrolase